MIQCATLFIAWIVVDPFLGSMRSTPRCMGRLSPVTGGVWRNNFITKDNNAFAELFAGIAALQFIEDGSALLYNWHCALNGRTLRLLCFKFIQIVCSHLLHIKKSGQSAEYDFAIQIHFLCDIFNEFISSINTFDIGVGHVRPFCMHAEVTARVHLNKYLTLVTKPLNAHLYI